MSRWNQVCFFVTHCFYRAEESNICTVFDVGRCGESFGIHRAALHSILVSDNLSIADTLNEISQQLDVLTRIADSALDLAKREGSISSDGK